MKNNDDTTWLDITELRGEVLLEDFDDTTEVNDDDLSSYFRSIDNNFFKDPF